MPRWFMILFMVSVDTWLNENSLLILNFFFILSYFGERQMFNNGVNYVFPDDIEVPSGQVKRFNESVIDPKCLLKSESTYACFDKKLFSSNNIFSCILLFLFWKYGLHAFKNGLVLINPLINTKFVKVLQFVLFIKICH